MTPFLIACPLIPSVPLIKHPVSQHYPVLLQEYGFILRKCFWAVLYLVVLISIQKVAYMNHALKIHPFQIKFKNLNEWKTLSCPLFSFPPVARVHLTQTRVLIRSVTLSYSNYRWPAHPQEVAIPRGVVE